MSKEYKVAEKIIDTLVSEGVRINEVETVWNFVKEHIACTLIKPKYDTESTLEAENQDSYSPAR